MVPAPVEVTRAMMVLILRMRGDGLRIRVCAKRLAAEVETHSYDVWVAPLQFTAGAVKVTRHAGQYRT